MGGLCPGAADLHSPALFSLAFGNDGAESMGGEESTHWLLPE